MLRASASPNSIHKIVWRRLSENAPSGRHRGPHTALASRGLWAATSQSPSDDPMNHPNVKPLMSLMGPLQTFDASTVEVRFAPVTGHRPPDEAGSFRATSRSSALSSMWFSCGSWYRYRYGSLHVPGQPWSNILLDGSTTASKDRGRQFFSCPARGVREHCGVV